MQFRTDVGSGGSKNFLKLKSGETVTGIFRGDPYEFHCVWENGKSRLIEENQEGSMFRFRINFVFRENGLLVAKIWEQGTTVYNALRDINEEYELEKTFVKISRNGNGTNTTYSIMPILKTKMTKDLEDQIKAVPLLSLEVKSKDSLQISAPSEGEEIPF